MFNISDLSQEDNDITVVFQLTYRLIKFTIKEYRPNELYASQWVDLFMVQSIKTTTKSNIFAEATLTELIDNNRAVLENKIQKSTINNFVELLIKEPHEKYVKLLRALCICDGEAMTANQSEISRLFFK